MNFFTKIMKGEGKWLRSKLLSKTHHRGMALVITLTTLVLVTVLIIAFFSRAQLNRQVSYSSTNQLKADLLARSALKIITGELRDEIADTTYSKTLNGGNSAYPTFYQPKTPTDLQPRQTGVASATGHIVKVSAANQPIRSNGTIQGSDVSISTPGRNGRLLTASRWFTSGTSSPQLGSQATLPTWFFVTRGNDIKTPASVADAKNPAKDDYIIGRFAYTVYDLGGLLDANLAGHPSSTQINADAAYKSSPAYADLTVLGLNATTVTDFLSWRNASTGADNITFNEWATGNPPTSGTSNLGAKGAAQSGHLSIVAGDNAVLSRHDLLDNAHLASNASLLTHFSRSINSPSFIPFTVTANNPALPDVRFSTSGTCTHYHDNGTTETYTVQAGDPLLQRRFSLAKLAWITSSGPNTSAFASSLSKADQTAAIKACFGLEWNTTTKQWDYTEQNDSFQIKPLSEVSTTSPVREPNFIELLKAGIVEGSLGTASTLASNGDSQTAALPSQQACEGSKDLQILQIGANMIDCVKSDNYSTTLTLDIAGTAVPVHGVVDLPYIYGLMANAIYNISYVDDAYDQVNSAALSLVPALFNPHIGGVTNTGNPTDIRVRIYCGNLQKVYLQNTGAVASATDLGSGRDLTDNNIIDIPSGNFENFRSAVKPVKAEEGSSNFTVTGTTPALGTPDRFHALPYYTYPAKALPAKFKKQTSDSNGKAGSQFFRTRVNNLLVVMEYKNPVTGWKIYDRLVGNEAYTSVGTGIGPKSANAWGNLDFLPNYSSLSKSGTTSIVAFTGTSGGVVKIDPRSTRFGVSNVNGSWAINPDMLTNSGLVFNRPFGTPNVSSGSAIYPGKWFQGGKKKWNDTDGTNIANKEDVDGTPRPADGSLGINLFSNLATTTNACRPVILHRPFRSVAELGYVFRESPWKTLSFFDETSGDSALLDLFSIADEGPVIAGRAFLNTTQTAVPQSLLSGVAQSYDGSSALSNPGAIASAYKTYATSGTVAALNVAGLANFMSSSYLTGAYSTVTTPIKSSRESVVRALAGNTQTRTWNLFIDVVAQTGRANTLSDFIVEGEKRYWLSIAIDRYTGKIISEQLEPANE